MASWSLTTQVRGCRRLLFASNAKHHFETKCYISTDSAVGDSRAFSKLNERTAQHNNALPNALARLPTSSILRSIFLSVFFTSPALFRPGFAVFQKIANSQSRWLNPDKNPVLRAVIRPIIYDHFCAGRNVAEIQRTSSVIKGLGFSGVVLCYGKEVALSADEKFLGYGDGEGAAIDAEIKQWRDGNLATLDMIKEGDWLGIK